MRQQPLEVGNRIAVGALVILAGFGFAGAASGELLGVFEGNDSESAIRFDLGLETLLLARVEPTGNRSGALSISISVTKNGDEPVSGAWDYASPSAVDLIVVKAGNGYAAYRHDVSIGDATSHSGLWDTSRLGNRELSHLTAYRVVPEPATAALLGLGFASLGLESVLRRKRRGRPSRVLEGARSRGPLVW